MLVQTRRQKDLRVSNVVLLLAQRFQLSDITAVEGLTLRVPSRQSPSPLVVEEVGLGWELGLGGWGGFGGVWVGV